MCDMYGFSFNYITDINYIVVSNVLYGNWRDMFIFHGYNQAWGMVLVANFASWGAVLTIPFTVVELKKTLASSLLYGTGPAIVESKTWSIMQFGVRTERVSWPSLFSHNTTASNGALVDDCNHFEGGNNATDLFLGCTDGGCSCLAWLLLTFPLLSPLARRIALAEATFSPQRLWAWWLLRFLYLHLQAGQTNILQMKKSNTNVNCPWKWQKRGLQFYYSQVQCSKLLQEGLGPCFPWKSTQIHILQYKPHLNCDGCIEIFDVQWPVPGTNSTTNYILSQNHWLVMPLAHYIYSTTREWNSTYYEFGYICLQTKILMCNSQYKEYYKLHSITESLANYAIGALHLWYYMRVKFYLLLFQVCLSTY